MDDIQIPLAEALQNLRRELYEAQKQSAGEGIVFAMEKVELELKVTAGSKAKGEAGIKFYVVSAGTGMESSSEAVHTIKLTLTPTDRAGKRIDVTYQTSEPPSRG